MAIIGAASGAAQVQTQQRVASGQKKAHRIAVERAGEQMSNEFAQSSQKLTETRKRLAEENDVARRQALIAGATASVSAGESGVAGGQTTNLVMAQFEKQRLEFETRKAAELEGYEVQHTYEKDAIEGRFDSTFLSTLPTTPSPSFLGALLTIGGGALQGYSTGLSNQIAREDLA